MSSLLLLLGGLLIIIKGGDWFVAAAVRLAELLHMPRVVIGSTLVSLATTTPELTVSIVAGLRGEPGLALGNAVGSCICNLGLILGITATLRGVVLSPALLRIPLGVMIAAGILPLVLAHDLRLGRAGGLILVLLGAGYFAWDFLRHLAARNESLSDAAVAVVQQEGKRLGRRHGLAATGAQFLGSAAIVVLGSKLLVDGAIGVATGLGVPAMVIGLTVIAFGTSLPEFITAVTSSRQAAGDLAVGNVLGANIANLTLIVGAAAILNDLALDRTTQRLHFPVLLAGMGLLVWKLARDRRLSRRDGIVLIAGYALYLLIVTGLMLRG
jgi:cation:H+ antiporter